MPQQPKQTPCSDCPWRVDARPAHWDRQYFLDIWASCQDDGIGVMLCHHEKDPSGPGPKRYCAGWVAVVAGDSIGFRMAVSFGRLDPRTFSPGVAELYEDFPAMMTAQGFFDDDGLPPRNASLHDAFELLARLQQTGQLGARPDGKDAADGHRDTGRGRSDSGREADGGRA